MYHIFTEHIVLYIVGIFVRILVATFLEGVGQLRTLPWIS